MIKKIIPYLHLMRLHRPIGIFLLLWPTLWALWLAAGGTPSFKNIFIFILGAIIMRSAGCVINDIADRKIDGHVIRTQHRPLATGQLSVKHAILLFLFLCSLAFILILFLNPFCQLLALIGLALTIFYPFTKRFTHFPQVVLGMAFAWSVPMAFAATLNTLPLSSWLIYFSALLWPIIYDTFYAMADKKEDIRIGVRSTAIFFGDNIKIIMSLFYGILLISLFNIGLIYHLKFIYFFSLSIASLFIAYQFWLTRTNNPTDYFRAFLNNNYLGFIIFLGILANYTL